MSEENKPVQQTEHTPVDRTDMVEKTEKSDDFYVGYFPLPKPLLGITLIAIVLLMAGGVAVSAAISISQSDPGAAVWDLSETVEWDFVVVDEPHMDYPMLYRIDPEGKENYKQYIPVSEGKFGATERLKGMNMKHVKLKGHTLSRMDRHMFEIIAADGAITQVGPSPLTFTPSISTPEETEFMDGEVIDPKCFSGAMKPGDGKAHQACAILCIRGGIPPVFVSRKGDEWQEIYMLVGPDGEAINEQVVPYVAEQVKLKGKVVSTGMAGQDKAWKILMVDIKDIEKQ